MERAVRDEIVRFVLERPENRHLDGGERYFDEPLVGFASAADPLFAEYKRIIGPFHRTPASFLAMEPDAPAMAPGNGHLLDSPRHPGDAGKQPQGTRVAFQGVGAHAELRREIQLPSASARGRFSVRARTPGDRPHAFPGLEADREHPRGDRLHMVGAPRRLCRGPGHLQPQRRADHRTGDRSSMRERDHRPGSPAHETVRHRSPGELPVLPGRKLRNLHRPVPGGSALPGRARQTEVQRIRAQRDPARGGGTVPGFRTRLRPLPDDGPLRGEDPADQGTTRARRGGAQRLTRYGPGGENRSMGRTLTSCPSPRARRTRSASRPGACPRTAPPRGTGSGFAGPA